jgi:hypothetical protein
MHKSSSEHDGRLLRGQKAVSFFGEEPLLGVLVVWAEMGRMCAQGRLALDHVLQGVDAVALLVLNVPHQHFNTID